MSATMKDPCRKG